MNRWGGTLALGGGGARGLAHLGAIEELVGAGFTAERIVGVSIGSLVGALFAFEPNIARVQRRTRDYLQSPGFARVQKQLFGAGPAPIAKDESSIRAGFRRLSKKWQSSQMLYRAARRRSFLAGRLLEQVVDHLLPDADIAHARIPLSIVTVDLHTGKPVIFEKGPLRLAVRASASIPGVFPPVAFENQLLCDIGEVDPLPLDVAHSYDPDVLVAVDVAAKLRPLSPSATALDVIMRMNEIGSAMYRAHHRREADLMIVPDVCDAAWFDFTAADSLLEAGRKAARAALEGFSPPQRWTPRMFQRKRAAAG